MLSCLAGLGSKPLTTTSSNSTTDQQQAAVQAATHDAASSTGGGGCADALRAEVHQLQCEASCLRAALGTLYITAAHLNEVSS